MSDKEGDSDEDTQETPENYDEGGDERGDEDGDQADAPADAPVEAPAAKKQKTNEKRFRAFAFTVHQAALPEVNFSELTDASPPPVVPWNSMFRYLIYSLEKCPKSGRLHLQGALLFKNGRTLRALRQERPGWHVESCYSTIICNRKYSKKAASHVCGPWEYGECPNQGSRACFMRAEKKVTKGATRKDVLTAIPEMYRYPQALDTMIRYHAPKVDFGITLTEDWEREVVEILSGPADWRTVYYIFDREGNKNKSRFCKYIEFNFPSVCSVGPMESKDLLYIYDGELIVLYDVPRNVAAQFYNWSVIENIKDGKWTSTKYTPVKRRRHVDGKGVPCHVIIFSNTPYDQQYMSADRVIVKTI